MTASEKIQSNQKKTLKGVTGLFQETVFLYRREFPLLFGYASWLLIPIALSFLAMTILTGPAAVIANFVVLTLYLVLAVWIVVILILLTPVVQTRKKFKLKNIGYRAWRVVIAYLLISIIVTSINIIGTLLFIIPGIIFGVWFSFASIIVVFKEIRLLDALKASRKLVRDKFWPVLWRLVGGFFMIAGLYLLALWVGFLIIGFIGGHDAETILLATPGIAEQTFASIVDVFFLPMFVMYHTLLFLDLTKNDKAK